MEYEYRRGSNAAQAARNINDVYGANTTNHRTTFYWFARFRSGNFDLQIEPRGRLKTLVDNDELKAIVEADYTQSTAELAAAFDVSLITILVHLRQIGKTNSTGDLKEENGHYLHSSSENFHKCVKRYSRSPRSILELYRITIKPKVYRSSSLSDLTLESSDCKADLLSRARRYLPINSRDLILDHCGDTLEGYWTGHSKNPPYMSWNFKGKKPKKKSQMASESYATKFAGEYYNQYQQESSCAEITSASSMDDILSNKKMASFPFKPTPSGNLKVQSNQVVFQSSTVGVLLADPTQAEVKVKFEGKSTDMEDTEDNGTIDSEQIQYNGREMNQKSSSKRASNLKDNDQALKSLGYTLSAPIDWMGVQLPKKQDLYQELFKRIHNHTNTDIIIQIGKNEFNCHRIVLQIYSSFFDTNRQRKIDIPEQTVTAKAFETIYDWMIFNSPESNKFLKRDNILDLFCAAQFLGIKDLEDQCWSFIVNENLFNEDTAFCMFREARLKGVPPVIDLMVPRIMRFFLPLIASPDFINLEVDEVMTILQSNYICVTSEIEVLMAGVRWLLGNWSDRCLHTVEIMRCVRFGLISPWQLVDIKRNPENSEILEIISDPEIQQMVDDGLAYVIIKYWYGNNSKNYYHWIDVLGLTEPAERNWIGEEKNHVTYKDFLEYLEQFRVPKEQMYQQMSMMQPARRSDDMPGGLRGMDKEKIDMHRQKFDFPLPAALQGLGNRENIPTMSDVFKNRIQSYQKSPSPPSARSPPPPTCIPQKKSPVRKQDMKPCINKIEEQQDCVSSEEVNSYTDRQSINSQDQDSVGPSEEKYISRRERQSVAASFLAAATAALSSGKRETARHGTTSPSDLHLPPQDSTDVKSQNKIQSPQISLFNQSKEQLAKMNMNKLSASVLGPSNKSYVADGSLFNWDRETVLVFGGTDPHVNYGIPGNTGKDIFRFDPVSNSWDNVGDLPEPRHHHSVAFMRGRVFLVGGADPREDDLRGKSVVVSTVWSYEPVTKSWYSESGLAIPRKNFGLVVHRMALYAIGGQDKKGRLLRSVERFDPKTGSWSEVRPMSTARMAVAAVKYREYIWVAGGMTGDKNKPVCKTVECYNSNTNEWTEIYSLRFPRCFATLFAMNDKLYIIGGAGKMSDKDKTPSSVGAIDVWDWKARQWKAETEMSIPRHGHALAYLGTQLIIIGGVTTIYMRALSNVESFCCERRAWIRGVATLPSPLSGHGAVTLPPASLM